MSRGRESPPSWQAWRKTQADVQRGRRGEERHSRVYGVRSAERKSRAAFGVGMMMASSGRRAGALQVACRVDLTAWLDKPLSSHDELGHVML